MVVAERKLVQVSLQILWRNGVESPMNRPFELRPETFNRVGVNVALDVLPLPVLDGFVKVSDRSDLVVTVGFIGCDDGVRRNHSLNQRHQRDHLDVFDGAGFDPALALDSAKHGSLASSTTPTLSTANATDVGFVQFDDLLAVQRIRRLSHKHPNLLVDSPRTFVGNAKVSFEFLGSYPVLALANQENGVKPHGKRCWAFVKNRPLSRVSLEAASASIGSAVSNWMERRLAALRAFQAFRITLLEDMSQASLVIGEVLFEVFNGVSHV